MRKRLLYIHIPFCDSKCHYCAFNSYIDKNHLKKQYEISLLEDLKYQFDLFKVEKKSFSTLFIGGGTPSTFSPLSYEKIFNFITPYLDDSVEITTEVNPSMSKDWISDMVDFGVNRVSVGVQSFNNEKLKLLGRNHSFKKAISAVENISKSGIDNISVDLIYDVAIDNRDILSHDIDIASSLPITHLSSYSLSIEDKTVFSNTPHMKLNDDDLAFWWLDTINENGFNSYEISSFAKTKEYECSHNKGYWSYYEYLGAGSGAIGFVGNNRYTCSKNIEKYIDNPTIYTQENISPQDQVLEKTFLGMRSNVGVCMDIFNKRQLERINILLQENKIIREENKIFNTSFLLSDEIVSFIYE